MGFELAVEIPRALRGLKGRAGGCNPSSSDHGNRCFFPFVLAIFCCLTWAALPFRAPGRRLDPPPARAKTARRRAWFSRQHAPGRGRAGRGGAGGTGLNHYHGRGGEGSRVGKCLPGLRVPGAPRRGACLLRAHQPARLGSAGREGGCTFPLPFLFPCSPPAYLSLWKGRRRRSLRGGGAGGASQRRREMRRGWAGRRAGRSVSRIASSPPGSPSNPPEDTSRHVLPPEEPSRRHEEQVEARGTGTGTRPPPPPPASFFSPSLRRGPRAPRACPSRPPRGRWAAAMFSGGTAGGPSLRYGFPPPHPSPKLKRSGAEAPPPRGKGKGGVNARVPCARHCLQGRAVRGRLRGR